MAPFGRHQWSRRVRDAKLETRTARTKLPVRGNPYYRSVGPDIHLGYRKGADARRWVARTNIGGGAYSMQIIGDADDLMDADGEKILSFDQAQEKARALVAKQRPNLYRRSSHRRLRPSYRRPRDGSPHRRPARAPRPGFHEGEAR